jgi:hypothetical protein
VLTSRHAAIIGTFALLVLAAGFIARVLCQAGICQETPLPLVDIFAIASFVLAMSVLGVFILPHVRVS